MRTFEIRRVTPLRFANICGVVLFAVYGVLSLLVFVPMAMVFAFVIAASHGHASGTLPPGPFLFLFPLMIVLYPILGGAMGWVTGFVSAFAFNAAVRFTGGVEVSAEERVAVAAPTQGRG